MKLHLPSRLRKALLACLAALVAHRRVSRTVSTGTALLGMFTMLWSTSSRAATQQAENALLGEQQMGLVNGQNPKDTLPAPETLSGESADANIAVDEDNGIALLGLQEVDDSLALTWTGEGDFDLTPNTDDNQTWSQQSTPLTDRIVVLAGTATSGKDAITVTVSGGEPDYTVSMAELMVGKAESDTNKYNFIGASGAANNLSVTGAITFRAGDVTFGSETNALSLSAGSIAISSGNITFQGAGNISVNSAVAVNPGGTLTIGSTGTMAFTGGINVAENAQLVVDASLYTYTGTTTSSADADKWTFGQSTGVSGDGQLVLKNLNAYWDVGLHARAGHFIIHKLLDGGTGIKELVLEDSIICLYTSESGGFANFDKLVIKPGSQLWVGASIPFKSEATIEIQASNGAIEPAHSGTSAAISWASAQSINVGISLTGEGIVQFDTGSANGGMGGGFAATGQTLKKTGSNVFYLNANFAVRDGSYGFFDVAGGNLTFQYNDVDSLADFGIKLSGGALNVNSAKEYEVAALSGSGSVSGSGSLVIGGYGDVWTQKPQEETFTGTLETGVKIASGGKFILGQGAVVNSGLSVEGSLALTGVVTVQAGSSWTIGAGGVLDMSAEGVDLTINGDGHLTLSVDVSAGSGGKLKMSKEVLNVLTDAGKIALSLLGYSDGTSITLFNVEGIEADEAWQEAAQNFLNTVLVGSMHVSSVVVTPTGGVTIIADESQHTLTWAPEVTTWEVGGSEGYWKEGEETSPFTNGDNVTFADSNGEEVNAVTISGTVEPGSITVSSGQFSFTGGTVNAHSMSLVDGSTTTFANTSITLSGENATAGTVIGGDTAAAKLVLSGSSSLTLGYAGVGTGSGDMLKNVVISGSGATKIYLQGGTEDATYTLRGLEGDGGDIRINTQGNSATLVLDTQAGDNFVSGIQFSDRAGAAGDKIKLVKKGSGTQTLTGNNMDAREVRVEGGTLNLTGTDLWTNVFSVDGANSMLDFGSSVANASTNSAVTQLTLTSGGRAIFHKAWSFGAVSLQGGSQLTVEGNMTGNGSTISVLGESSNVSVSGNLSSGSDTQGAAKEGITIEHGSLTVTGTLGGGNHGYTNDVKVEGGSLTVGDESHASYASIDTLTVTGGTVHLHGDLYAYGHNSTATSVSVTGGSSLAIGGALRKATNRGYGRCYEIIIGGEADEGSNVMTVGGEVYAERVRVEGSNSSFTANGGADLTALSIGAGGTATLTGALTIANGISVTGTSSKLALGGATTVNGAQTWTIGAGSVFEMAEEEVSLAVAEGGWLEIVVNTDKNGGKLRLSAAAMDSLTAQTDLVRLTLSNRSAAESWEYALFDTSVAGWDSVKALSMVTALLGVDYVLSDLSIDADGTVHYNIDPRDLTWGGVAGGTWSNAAGASENKPWMSDEGNVSFSDHDNVLFVGGRGEGAIIVDGFIRAGSMSVFGGTTWSFNGDDASTDSLLLPGGLHLTQLGTSVGFGDSLTLSLANITFENGTGGEGSSAVTFSGTQVTLTSSQPGISGAGTVTFSDAATLTWDAASDLVIGDGSTATTLTIGGSTTVGQSAARAGDLQIKEGSTVTLEGTGAVYTGAVQVDGNLVLDGTGTVNVNGGITVGENGVVEFKRTSDLTGCAVSGSGTLKVNTGTALNQTQFNSLIGGNLDSFTIGDGTAVLLGSSYSAHREDNVSEYRVEAGGALTFNAPLMDHTNITVHIAGRGRQLREGETTAEALTSSYAALGLYNYSGWTSSSQNATCTFKVVLDDDASLGVGNNDSRTGTNASGTSAVYVQMQGSIDFAGHALTKVGYGELRLNGAFSASGESGFINVENGKITLAYTEHADTLQNIAINLCGSNVDGTPVSGSLDVNESVTVGALYGSGTVTIADQKTLTLSNGSADQSFTGTLSGSGTLQVHGGTFTLGDGFSVAEAATPQIVVDNGATLVLGYTSSASTSYWSNTVLEVNGKLHLGSAAAEEVDNNATYVVKGLNGTGSEVRLAEQSGNAKLIIDTTEGEYSFSGALNDNPNGGVNYKFDLVKRGEGTQTFATSHFDTKSTTVEGGTLKFTAAGTTWSAFTVESGGTAIFLQGWTFNGSPLTVNGGTVNVAGKLGIVDNTTEAVLTIAGGGSVTAGSLGGTGSEGHAGRLRVGGADASGKLTVGEKADSYTGDAFMAKSLHVQNSANADGEGSIVTIYGNVNFYDCVNNQANYALIIDGKSKVTIDGTLHGHNANNQLRSVKLGNGGELSVKGAVAFGDNYGLEVVNGSATLSGGVTASFITLSQGSLTLGGSLNVANGVTASGGTLKLGTTASVAENLVISLSGSAVLEMKEGTLTIGEDKQLTLVVDAVSATEGGRLRLTDTVMEALSRLENKINLSITGAHIGSKWNYQLFDLTGLEGAWTASTALSFLQEFLNLEEGASLTVDDEGIVHYALGKDLTWRGGESDVWDAAATNWQEGDETGRTFGNKDSVTFGAAGAGHTNITVSGELTPGDIRVTDRTAYTFTGQEGNDSIVAVGNLYVDDGSSATFGGLTSFRAGGGTVAGNLTLEDTVAAKSLGGMMVEGTGSVTITDGTASNWTETTLSGDGTVVLDAGGSVTVDGTNNNIFAALFAAGDANVQRDATHSGIGRFEVASGTTLVLNDMGVIGKGLSLLRKLAVQKGATLQFSANVFDNSGGQGNYTNVGTLVLSGGETGDAAVLENTRREGARNGVWVKWNIELEGDAIARNSGDDIFYFTGSAKLNAHSHTLTLEAPEGQQKTFQFGEGSATSPFGAAEGSTGAISLNSGVTLNFNTVSGDTFSGYDMRLSENSTLQVKQDATFKTLSGEGTVGFDNNITMTLAGESTVAYTGTIASGGNGTIIVNDGAKFLLGNGAGVGNTLNVLGTLAMEAGIDGSPVGATVNVLNVGQSGQVMLGDHSTLTVTTLGGVEDQYGSISGDGTLKLTAASGSFGGGIGSNFEYAGSGTFTYSGAFTGANLTVTSGTLTLESSATFGGSTVATVEQSGKLNLNNGSYGGMAVHLDAADGDTELMHWSGNAEIKALYGKGKVTVGYGTDTLTISGQATEEQVFEGNVCPGGNVTVNLTGTMYLGDGANLGNTVKVTGTLAMKQSDSVISATVRTLHVGETGQVQLGVNDTLNVTTLDGIEVDGSKNYGAITGSGTLHLTANAANTFNGAISADLTYTGGANTLMLGGAFTGSELTIESGTVTVNNIIGASGSSGEIAQGSPTSVTLRDGATLNIVQGNNAIRQLVGGSATDETGATLIIANNRSLNAASATGSFHTITLTGVLRLYGGDLSVGSVISSGALELHNGTRMTVEDFTAGWINALDGTSSLTVTGAVSLTAAASNMSGGRITVGGTLTATRGFNMTGGRLELQDAEQELVDSIGTLNLGSTAEVSIGSRRTLTVTTLNGVNGNYGSISGDGTLEIAYAGGTAASTGITIQDEELTLVKSGAGKQTFTNALKLQTVDVQAGELEVMGDLNLLENTGGTRNTISVVGGTLTVTGSLFGVDTSNHSAQYYSHAHAGAMVVGSETAAGHVVIGTDRENVADENALLQIYSLTMKHADSDVTVYGNLSLGYQDAAVSELTAGTLTVTRDMVKQGTLNITGATVTVGGNYSGSGEEGEDVVVGGAITLSSGGQMTILGGMNAGALNISGKKDDAHTSKLTLGSGTSPSDNKATSLVMGADGEVELKAQASLELADLSGTAGSITGDGLLKLTAASGSFGGGIGTNFEYAGSGEEAFTYTGVFTGANMTVTSGNLTLEDGFSMGGNSAPTITVNGGTLTVAAALEAGGDISVANGGTLTLQSGSISLSEGHKITVDGTTSKLAIDLTDGNFSADVGVELANGGVIDLSRASGQEAYFKSIVTSGTGAGNMIWGSTAGQGQKVRVGTLTGSMEFGSESNAMVSGQELHLENIVNSAEAAINVYAGAEEAKVYVDKVVQSVGNGSLTVTGAGKLCVDGTHGDGFHKTGVGNFTLNSQLNVESGAGLYMTYEGGLTFAAEMNAKGNVLSSTQIAISEGAILRYGAETQGHRLLLDADLFTGFGSGQLVLDLRGIRTNFSDQLLSDTGFDLGIVSETAESNIKFEDIIGFSQYDPGEDNWWVKWVEEQETGTFHLHLGVQGEIEITAPDWDSAWGTAGLYNAPSFDGDLASHVWSGSSDVFNSNGEGTSFTDH